VFLVCLVPFIYFSLYLQGIYIAFEMTTFEVCIFLERQSLYWWISSVYSNWSINLKYSFVISNLNVWELLYLFPSPWVSFFSLSFLLLDAIYDNFSFDMIFVSLLHHWAFWILFFFAAIWTLSYIIFVLDLCLTCAIYSSSLHLTL